MKILKTAGTGLLILVLAFTACRKEEKKSETMADVYQQKGIPVKTRTLKTMDFSTFLSFTSPVRGIKESTGSSMVADTIEKVLVEVGDFVEKDQILIQIPKNNPTANYYQAKAAYNAAEQSFARIKNLYKSSGTSRQNYDNARTQYEVQKATWENVQNMVDIKAPISGYVTRLTVNESENVRPGETLFTISNYDKLIATVWVSDREIGTIQKGQRAEAFWHENTIPGRVSRVDLSKNEQKKAFAVWVEFDNSGHKIPSGVTVDIDIETSLTKDAIVIQRREILSDSKGDYVFLEKDSHARRQDITTGIRQGMFLEITSGLKPRDRLVTEGLSLVKEGILIRNMGESAPLDLKPQP